eukprot:SAG25_NODE_11237_length_310_cov_0.720379_1_plen_45_part_01
MRAAESQVHGIEMEEPPRRKSRRVSGERAQASPAELGITDPAALV